MTLEIDINESTNRFILQGNINPLLGDSRSMLYVKRFLSGLVIENQIEIPYESNQAEEVLKKIQKILDRSHHHYIMTDKVTKILIHYFRDEEVFAKFSTEARSIRNNELEGQRTIQFRDFSRLLSTEMRGRTLYPLQLLSAFHLAFSQNSCNFSVPGSGKTSIVYGAYSYLKSLPEEDPKKVNKLLVVGPLSSFGPWEDEYFDCFGREPSVKRISGNVPSDERTYHFYSSNPAEITLISYFSVYRIMEDLIFFLKKHKVMVILDEAHKIKNVEGGVIASSVLEISKFARSRVVLTGTPVPNGYQDLFNLFKFIWPSKNIIPFNTYQLAQLSDKPIQNQVDVLTDAISPYFIRIRKKDLGIPDPREHQPIIVPMGETQKEIYDFIENKYMGYFINQSNAGSSFADVMSRARLIRLMQASTNPALLEKPLDDYFKDEGLSNALFLDDSSVLRNIRNYYSHEIPPKFTVAKDLIETIIRDQGKVVVWVTFIKNIEDFSAYLTQNGIPNRTIYGATPIESNEDDEFSETRESIIRDFHDPESDFKVLVANPFAVSESISLHKVCHNAIYLERTFNAAHFLQSKDRIHRYGLQPTDIINYYYLLSDNNVDISIDEALRNKEKRMLDIIEHEEIPLLQRLEDNYSDDVNLLIRNYVNNRPL